MDFNKITEKDEKAVKAKFKEYGVGVNMSAFTSDSFSNWEDLINKELFTSKNLRDKMLFIAAKINTMCNDKLLGDTNIAFTHTTDRDEEVKFTWLDIYTFLRAAYRHRIETEEYRTMKAKAEELRAFIEDNKSVDVKLKNAERELKELEQKL